MISEAPGLSGWLPTNAGPRRIFLPRHVAELDKFERKLWMAERKVQPIVSGGTSFSGFETLAVQSATVSAVGPTASLLSILPRESLEPVQPAYLNQIGRRFWAHAYGTISTTATVPTYQLQLVTGPTYANPLTSGQMLAQNAAITPAASTTGNLEYWLDVYFYVRATGSSATIVALGTLINDWAAAGTYVVTPFKNATPPTAVTLTGTGGALVPLYFDIEIIMGAATAGNSITNQDYHLVSMN